VKSVAALAVTGKDMSNPITSSKTTASPALKRLPLERYVDGVLAGDRVVLARAITVIESDLPADGDLAARLLDKVLPHSGLSRRVGITGVPGVGKSTFIDALGMHLIRDCGESVAVLSVDPSSPISGGSILGDKTRMERLAIEERAFIRPSPARGHLGGVARHTRETILLCEAAGYRNILVETVGVGQSETAVRSMTDFFLLLMLAGAGDELQGMKRGIIEMLDGMAINKSDGDNKLKAERARTEYAHALHLFPASADGWIPSVMTCSSLSGEGIAEVWQMVLQHRKLVEGNGCLAQQRSRQALDWMNELVILGLEKSFQTDPAVAARLPLLKEEVQRGQITPFAASRELLGMFHPQQQGGRRN
jgi:LAO/AO transport system kinase